MMRNKDELSYINKKALIHELVEKAKSCAILWHKIGPAQFKATNSGYDFYLSRSGPTIVTLDIHKDGCFYRSHNSSTFSDIDELYRTVDLLLFSSHLMERTRSVSSFIGTIVTAADADIEIEFRTASGGSEIGGSADVSQLQSATIDLLPTSLTFGPAPFPWAGGLSSITDSPNADSHDGDEGFIRQEVAGALPTYWGYAICDFDHTQLLPTGPYRFSVNVAHRRETETGVYIVVDVLMNSSVVYTNQVSSEEDYNVFHSGWQTAPEYIEPLTELKARVSIFTNTGNENPRALRVSAIDLRFETVEEG